MALESPSAARPCVYTHVCVYEEYPCHIWLMPLSLRHQVATVGARYSSFSLTSAGLAVPGGQCVPISPIRPLFLACAQLVRFFLVQRLSWLPWLIVSLSHDPLVLPLGNGDVALVGGIRM